MTETNAKTSKYQSRCCNECGALYTPRRCDELFCSTPCRKAFENRRMTRGAEMYDLFRAMRRERDAAKELGIWKEICRLEQRWNEEDEAERPGRRSYRAPKTALRKLREDGRLMIGEQMPTMLGGKMKGAKR